MSAFHQMSLLFAVTALLSPVLVGCEDSPPGPGSSTEVFGELVVVPEVRGELSEGILVRWDDLDTSEREVEGRTLLRTRRFLRFTRVPTGTVEVFFGERDGPPGCTIEPSSTTVEVIEDVRHAVIFLVDCR